LPDFIIIMKTLETLLLALLSSFAVFLVSGTDTIFETNDSVTVTCPSGFNCTVDVSYFQSVNEPGSGASIHTNMITFGNAGQLSLGGCINPPCDFTCSSQCTCTELNGGTCKTTNSSTNTALNNPVGGDGNVPNYALGGAGAHTYTGPNNGTSSGERVCLTTTTTGLLALLSWVL
jgi:hypothetical protein